MLTNATTNLRCREISRASGKRLGYTSETLPNVRKAEVANTENALHVHLRPGDSGFPGKEAAHATGRILITGEKVCQSLIKQYVKSLNIGFSTKKYVANVALLTHLKQPSAVAATARACARRSEKPRSKPGPLFF